ncbi:hypothetical protein [uncultured Polaribacter sp.]|uniref:hypothetical protein n=1 Tax=uncultured Polaribacter sp. TaxID=174711 RepID=UPI002602980A|nr:hypothetical protein [uncultured Polaribacter sp.]
MINNFIVACEKLGYKDVINNPVKESVTYKAIGKGLQWGTNAVILVEFKEKEGYTNASFEIIKQIRFPKFGKQKLAEKFYKEIIGLVELLNETTIKDNQPFNDTENETNSESIENERKVAENKRANTLNNRNDSENVNTYLDKNNKKKKNKLLIFGGILILFLMITQLSKSSSSPSSSINACECSERWLATPKSMMKSTDKWKYDECVRKYGGFAGAHAKCNE